MPQFAYGKDNQSWLLWFLRGLLILIFFVVLIRITELQIIKGKYYRKLSEGNRIRRITIHAPRGKVFARGGEVLIGNTIVKKEVVFGKDGEISVVDAKDTSEVGEKIIVDYSERYYPLGEAFLHVGGYISDAYEEDVGKINPQCPQKGHIKLGSQIGRSGLESYYDCVLSGIDGEMLIEVDTKGDMVRVLGEKKEVAGQDIYTSIDFDTQREIPKFMEGTKGAVILSDMKGQIIALYSSPSFDPNKFGKKDSQIEVENALSDPDLPLFNRAIGGIYHPGSVFKPVVTIAALEEKKISRDYLYRDEGFIKVGDYLYTNWYFTQYGRIEGEINVIKAIARSTDTFFYKLGELLGPNKIAFWAEKFNMGKGLGIDIPGETKGLIPTPDWKEKTKNEMWFLGNTYHLSIGQGDLALTPIEINAALASFANGGKICSLKIKNDEAQCTNLKINQDNFDIVKEGMLQACSTGGTGYTFFDFSPKAACKTGTAETNVDGKTHAWFNVFAPYDYPEVSLTVMIEGGGEGSKVAGPVARSIFDFYFNRISTLKE